MASKARFLDNVGVSAFGTNSGGGSSISSSYALSASYADSATSASYAISASYEITKEVSSSYADTASFAQSGDGIFSGSFSGSFQGAGAQFGTTYFVAPEGNDSTGEYGNISQPFKTITGARNQLLVDSLSGQTLIYVFPGTYDETELQYPNGKMYLSPGSLIEPSAKIEGAGAAMTSVNQGAKTFTFNGNWSTNLITGKRFRVVGGANDGIYTIVLATDVGGTTEVVVSETIPSASVGGKLSTNETIFTLGSTPLNAPSGSTSNKFDLYGEGDIDVVKSLDDDWSGGIVTAFGSAEFYGEAVTWRQEKGVLMGGYEDSKMTFNGSILELYGNSGYVTTARDSSDTTFNFDRIISNGSYTFLIRYGSNPTFNGSCVVTSNVIKAIGSSQAIGLQRMGPGGRVVINSPIVESNSFTLNAAQNSGGELILNGNIVASTSNGSGIVTGLDFGNEAKFTINGNITTDSGRAFWGVGNVNSSWYLNGNIESLSGSTDPILDLGAGSGSVNLNGSVKNTDGGTTLDGISTGGVSIVVENLDVTADNETITSSSPQTLEILHSLSINNPLGSNITTTGLFNYTGTTNVGDLVIYNTPTNNDSLTQILGRNSTTGNVEYRDVQSIALSASYADTASFAQSGDGIFSGSFSGSFQGDGSNLTGVGAFPFSGSAVITGSLTITGSQSNGFTPVEKLDLGRYYFKTKNSFDTGLLGSFGGELIISSSDFGYKTPMVVLDRTQGPFGDDIGTDLWARNNLFAGGSTYVNGIINTLFSVTGSGQTGQGGVINLGNPYGISPTTNVINLYGHLTASAGVNISASATSTASFGTYLGDGSQLTGIETDPFPYTGDAVISGSLTVQSGSSNSITGITLINPSSPGTTQDTGAGITMFNYTGATGSIHIKDYTAGGSNPYHPAMIFNSSDAFFFQAADDARDGTWFTAQKVYQQFHMDQINNNAAEWIMGINNGGSSYSRLVIGQGSTTANGWFFQNNGYDEDLKIGETTGAGGTGTYTNRILISSSRMQIGDSSNDLKLSVSGSITSNNTASAAYFVGDGSQLTNLPASSTFPFTGDAVITGSLVVSSSNSTASLTLEGSGSTVFDVIGSQGTLFSVDDDLSGTIFTANDISGLPILEASASGDVYIGKSPQSLYTTAVISSTTAATTQSIFGLSTSSYDGAFFDYTVQSGSNARAGSIMSVWNGSTINFTETTTTDIGNTTDFNLIVHISQSQAQIASHATNAGYKIKTIIRSI